MMPRAITDQDGPLPGEAPGARFPCRRVAEGDPTPERRAWVARVARIAKSTGLPLNPDAIDPATTIYIGMIPVADALRLALAGRATDMGNFLRGDLRWWKIEITDADDGEPVVATVLT